jgi:NAD-dependent dihydropyrimidine dehydrogenase PreA subunit
MVQYKTVIDEKKCIFCLNCVVACPQEVIEADYKKKKAVVVDQVQCIACINCEESCPAQAVKIIGDKRIDWKIPPERWPELHANVRYARGP